MLNSADLEKLDIDEFGVEISQEVCPKVYRGGYFKNLEERSAFLVKVFCTGDHTFGDILKLTDMWLADGYGDFELEDEINI